MTVIWIWAIGVIASSAWLAFSFARDGTDIDSDIITGAVLMSLLWPVGIPVLLAANAGHRARIKGLNEGEGR